MLDQSQSWFFDCMAMFVQDTFNFYVAVLMLQIWHHGLMHHLFLTSLQHMELFGFINMFNVCRFSICIQWLITGSRFGLFYIASTVVLAYY